MAPATGLQIPPLQALLPLLPVAVKLPYIRCPYCLCTDATTCPHRLRCQGISAAPCWRCLRRLPSVCCPLTPRPSLPSPSSHVMTHYHAPSTVVLNTSDFASAPSIEDTSSLVKDALLAPLLSPDVQSVLPNPPPPRIAGHRKRLREPRGAIRKGVVGEKELR